MAGVKCPSCLNKGISVWLIPGKSCPACNNSTVSSKNDKDNNSNQSSNCDQDDKLDQYNSSLNTNQTNSLSNTNNPKSPLNQFDINYILDINMLSKNILLLSNIGLYLTITVSILCLISLIANNFSKIAPNRSSSNQESVYATVYSIVINQLDEFKGQVFFPFIFTLFIVILSNNLIGMIPYTFASTSHFIVTFSLSFTLVLGATVLGLYIHVFKFFSLLVPSGCPLPLLPLLVLIEFISYIARNVSLGLRLAANVLSGHMLLNILSGFTYNIMKSGYLYSIIALLPLSFVTAFSALEMGIAFIQAQVYAVLSGSYVKDGLNLH